ncbi:MAG: YhbY family RNA-binding protein [Promethearchaeota archaeon]
MKEINQYNYIAVSKASVKIGKKLISDGKINQIMQLTKKRGMIKIKFLKSAITNIEETIVILLQRTKLNLLDFRGNTIIVSQKPLKDKKISIKCKKIIQQSRNDLMIQQSKKV